MSDLSELESTWQRLRGTSIPSLSSEDAELDDLRAELIEFDGHVAGLVSTVLGHSRPRLPLSGLARKFAHVCGVRTRLLLRGMQARARRRRRRLRLVPTRRS